MCGNAEDNPAIKKTKGLKCGDTVLYQTGGLGLVDVRAFFDRHLTLMVPDWIRQVDTSTDLWLETRLGDDRQGFTCCQLAKFEQLEDDPSGKMQFWVHYSGYQVGQVMRLDSIRWYLLDNRQALQQLADERPELVVLAPKDYWVQREEKKAKGDSKK